MVTNEEYAVKPGYVSWSSFLTFLDMLRAEGIPTQIDHSVLSNMSGTVQSQLRLALQYMDLIDEEYQTKSKLEDLALASDEDRKEILGSILKDSYTQFFDSSTDFDLTTGTYPLFSKLFSDSGLTGETKYRAESFFLNAAEFCEIDVSKYIIDGRKKSRTTRRKPSKPTASSGKKKGHKDEELSDEISDMDPEQPGQNERKTNNGHLGNSLLNGRYGLLHKLQIEELPKDGMWTAEERERYLNSYKSILDLKVEIIPDE